MDPGRIQIPWLSSFVAIVELGTVTHAAKSLRLSQPRVSAHIAALEAVVGGRLFERLPRGMSPTELGDTLLPFARGALAELWTASESLAAGRHAIEGTVRLASYPGASAALVAPAMQSFTALHPGVAFDLHEGDAGFVEWSVARGVVDLAIRPSGQPRRFPALPSIPLCHERIVLVTHEDEDVAGDVLGFLSDRTVIVSGDPHDGWVDYRDDLQRAGVQVRNVMVASMPTTVTALVGAGMGVGVLGAFAARSSQRSNTRIVELPGQTWTREVRIIMNDAKPLRPVSEAFLTLLRDAVPGLARG